MWMKAASVPLAVGSLSTLPSVWQRWLVYPHSSDLSLVCVFSVTLGRLNDLNFPVLVLLTRRSGGFMEVTDFQLLHVLFKDRKNLNLPSDGPSRKARVQWLHKIVYVQPVRLGIKRREYYVLIFFLQNTSRFCIKQLSRIHWALPKSSWVYKTIVASFFFFF